MNSVYFDNAATTCILPEVLDTMTSVLKDSYGNPSGIYNQGITAKNLLKKARKSILQSLNASNGDVFFTSGGSESDNWAIKGVMYANRNKGRHLITTEFEHHAVIESAKWLEKEGFRVTYVKVNKEGFVEPSEIEKAICDDTVLISVMFANNEIGTVQPIREIAEIAHRHNVLFHTDAVQAVGKTNIDVDEMNIDILSASAHKFHGPKGIGFLYIRNGVSIDSLIHGGVQEKNHRAGTENVAAICGMAKALEICYFKMEEWNLQEQKLSDYVYNRITDEIEGVRLNGSINNRMPSNLNFSISGIEGETLLISLDMKKIAVSTGSACAVSIGEPSHVLTSIGCNVNEARSSVRISFSGLNTMEEAEYFVDELKETVSYLRKIRI